MEIEIDLSLARNNAEAASAMLNDFRSRFDLAAFEYTKKIRIAPFEVPHSHPVLTINSMEAVGPTKDKVGFLATYLHEQFHWALDLFKPREAENAIVRFKDTFPALHSSPPCSAVDEQSTYLHIIVNWLELDAVEQLLGAEVKAQLAGRRRFYKDVYRVVLDNWQKCEKTLVETDVLPLPPAN